LRVSVGGVLWRAALIALGAAAGATAGRSVAPDVPLVAGGLAVSGAALGVLIVLVAGWTFGRKRTAPVPEEAPAAAPPPPPAEAPGWYADPAGEGGQRYWDGSAWSDHVWRRRR
jgi:hypothetical protein